MSLLETINSINQSMNKQRESSLRRMQKAQSVQPPSGGSGQQDQFVRPKPAQMRKAFATLHNQFLENRAAEAQRRAKQQFMAQAALSYGQKQEQA